MDVLQQGAAIMKISVKIGRTKIYPEWLEDGDVESILRNKTAYFIDSYANEYSKDWLGLSQGESSSRQVVCDILEEYSYYDQSLIFSCSIDGKGPFFALIECDNAYFVGLTTHDEIQHYIDSGEEIVEAFKILRDSSLLLRMRFKKDGTTLVKDMSRATISKLMGML